MRLWRLSSARRAQDFDGGYGLSNDGRWNTRGRPVTYAATVASLAALEKRVHVRDAALLPPQVLVAYDVPDNSSSRVIPIAELPDDWTLRQTFTQRIGDEWLDSTSEVLLIVPSVVIPVENVPDRNVLINHAVPEAAAISISGTVSFAFDPRLFVP